MTEKGITEKVPSEEAAVFASSSIDRANVLTRTPKMKATIRRQSSLTNIPACEFNRNDSTTPNNVFSFPNNNNDDQQTNWTDVEMRQKCDQHQQMNGASAQNNPVEAAMLPNNSEKTQANSIVLAEQLELVTTQLNRALCSRMELQEELNLVKKHLENTSRDYEETMMERSSVLEENNRLTEERDRLKDSVKHLSNTLHNMINSKSEHQVQQLQSKLEHTRRLLQLNMEETALANSKREQTNEELERVRIICDTLEKERDQALFQLNNLDEQDEEPLFDCWINHSIQIALPSPSSTNLGVILGGGKGDEMFSSGMPIFVRDLIPGSPFDGHLKPLDFILNVNDIDVSTMDQRSVVDILSNSCNLKMVVKRRNDAFRVMEYSFNDISDLGAEFEDGVFISKIDENSGGAESGLTAGTRLIHVNGVPVRDASHTKALLDANKDNLVLGVMSLKTHSPRRQSTKPATINAPHPNKQRSRFLNKVHDKLFGRGNGASGSDKNRAIIAHANLDACIGELTSYRHGSLRIPTSRLSHSINHQLVRTGSLRTTTANAGGSHPITDPRQINEQLDKFFQRPSQSHDDDGSVRTWPKSNEPSISNDSQSNRKTTNNRPSVLPAFSSTSNYPCAAITSTNSNNNNNNNVNENGNALRRSTDIMLASPTNSHLSSYTHPHSHNNSSYMVDANPYHLVDHQPQISSPVRPYSWYRPPSSINNPPQSIYSASARIVTSTNLLLAQPKLIGIAHSQRVNSSGNTSTRSPALPQPPPYPGPRSSVDSLSIASSNSYPLPQSSSTTPTSYHPSFSPSGTILKGSDSQLLEEDEEIRRVVVNRDGCGGFGLALDNNENGGVVISNVYGPSKGRVHVGEQLLDVCGINMRSADRLAATRVLRQFCASHDEVTLLLRRNNEASRWIRVPRRSIRLCGGNATGILVEIPVGNLNMGERILEIDGKDVREATLEEATRELENGRSEMVNLLTVYDGGERLKRLRKGADSDSFFMRVNIDRNGENGDELDIKKGEIVYVDNTLFMGVNGRWRAWRVDHEGRQRQCGIIPSEWRVQEEEASRQRRSKGRISDMKPLKHLYERVERVPSSQRRPLVLVSAYLAPFMQALIDEHGDKFAQCVPECRALNASEGEGVSTSGQWIEVRRREQLFEVISVSALEHMISQGYHCVLDITPHAIVRLHSLRIYPILIRIKFKSAKQLKELAEESGSERINSKTAKEMIERFDQIDSQLDALECNVSTIVVGAHRARNAVKYVCQQIVAIVEHEQKRTVWAPAIKQTATNNGSNNNNTNNSSSSTNNNKIN